jgi:diguanylate cyclase (GGDEF)-like protein
MARSDAVGIFDLESKVGKREWALIALFFAVVWLAALITQDVFLICFGIYLFASGVAGVGIVWIFRQSDERFDATMPPSALIVFKLCIYLSAVALPVGGLANVLCDWLISNFEPQPDFAGELSALGAIACVLLPAGAVPLEFWRIRALERLKSQAESDEGALRQVAALERLAFQDALTGLPNRRCFEDALAQLSKDDREFAVMFVDFDKFKPINDVHGHAVGDEFLKAIAKRIESLVRGSDLVARLGGDEFAVLIKGSDALGASKDLAERVARAMRESVACAGVELRSSASVGVAIGRCGLDDVGRVVHQADMAMYEAKRAGGACMRIADWSAADPQKSTDL